MNWAEHIRALQEQKRAARHQVSRNKLSRAVSRSKELLTLAVNRGDNVAMTETALLRLLDSYGADELDAAIAGALERDSAQLLINAGSADTQTVLPWLKQRAITLEFGQ